jgi:hypothetical protein
MKRIEFLKSFLSALGAVDILWTDIQIDKIYGTVIYDYSDDVDERQDFVWHMTEENVPNEDVRKLLDFLIINRLIDIDKIIIPIEKIQIDFLEQSNLESTWDMLFDIEVMMLDKGVESDSFFIHD